MTGIFVLRCVSAPFLRFALSSNASTVVGRSSQCHFVVDHPSVSRRHAQLLPTDQGFTLTDLGSLNGTFVDDLRVQSCLVSHGQIVRFGSLSFTVAVEDHDAKESSGEKTPRNNSRPVSLANMPTLDLSDARRRVFDLLLSGQTEKCIAAHLELSPHTVHNHVRVIFRVFGVHSRAELLARLLRSEGKEDQAG